MTPRSIGSPVEDIQNEIEIAVGRDIFTYTVEKQERLPVCFCWVLRARWLKLHQVRGTDQTLASEAAVTSIA